MWALSCLLLFGRCLRVCGANGFNKRYGNEKDYCVAPVYLMPPEFDFKTTCFYHSERASGLVTTETGVMLLLAANVVHFLHSHPPPSPGPGAEEITARAAGGDGGAPALAPVPPLLAAFTELALVLFWWPEAVDEGPIVCDVSYNDAEMDGFFFERVGVGVKSGRRVAT